MDAYMRVSFVVEMAVILFIFTLHFQKKPHFLFRAVPCIIVTLCVNAFWNEGWGMFYVFLRYLVIIFLFYLTLELCFREKTSKKLFALTAAYSIQTVLYILYSIVGSMFYRRTESPWTELYCLIAYLIIYGIGCAVSLLFFSKKMVDSKNVNLENRVMIALSLCIVLVSNFFNILMIYARIPWYAYELIYKPMSIIPCVLLLCLQFNLISNLSLMIDRKTLEQLVMEKDKQYQISKRNIELIQMKCHDLKYQIRALQQSGRNLDPEALEEIQNNVDIYERIVKTGNEALDVILTEKSLICQKLKITIMVMLEGSRLNYIDVTDLYCIFGNAIDNALEAVEKEKDTEKRLISITSRLVGNLFSIRITNYFSGELKIENGLPLSSKEDKENHGFGLKSIRYIVEKYNGSFSVYQEDDLFVLNILLPLK